MKQKLPVNNVELAEWAQSLLQDVRIGHRSSILYKTYALLELGRHMASDNALTIALNLADVVLGEEKLAALDHYCQNQIIRCLHLYLELSITQLQDAPQTVYFQMVERHKDCLKSLREILPKQDQEAKFEIDCIWECLNLLKTNNKDYMDIVMLIIDLKEMNVGNVLKRLQKLYEKISHKWYVGVRYIRQMGGLIIEATQNTDTARDSVTRKAALEILDELQTYVQENTKEEVHQAIAMVQVLTQIIQYSSDETFCLQALEGVSPQKIGLTFFTQAKNEVLRYHALKALLLLSKHPNPILQEKVNEQLMISSRLEKNEGIKNLRQSLVSTTTLSDWREWGQRYQPNLTGASAEPSLEDRLEQLRQRILTDEDLLKEQAAYIPVSGSHSHFDPELFDVEKEVNKYLASEKKVLLLLGDAGAGKSTFGRFLEQQMWKQYKPGDVIPLFIALPLSKDPLHGVVEGYLQSHGFNLAHIGELKQTRKFVIMLDGYDEINRVENLYATNHLWEWQAKVMISCRSQYLTQRSENYRNRFFPHRKEEVLYQALQEMLLRPFDDSQIDAYLKKYVEINLERLRDEGSWTDWNQYKEHIHSIPHLKQLIETPFILRIVAEVLPEISKRYQNEKAAERVLLTRATLYEVFVERWFNRQYAKLCQQGNPVDESIKEDFLEFSKLLAEKMCNYGITVVTYNAPGRRKRFGQESQEPMTVSEWEMFFKDEAETRLVRSGCPIRKVAENQYAFIHASVQEYFGARKIFDEIILPDARNTSREEGLVAAQPDEKIKPKTTDSQARATNNPPSFFPAASNPLKNDTKRIILYPETNPFYDIHLYLLDKKEEKEIGYQARLSDFSEILTLFQNQASKKVWLASHCKAHSFGHANPFKKNRYQERRAKLLNLSEDDLRNTFQEYQLYLEQIVNKVTSPSKGHELTLCQALVNKAKPTLSQP